VWTVQYRARQRHPGVVEAIAGEGTGESKTAAVINKVLFPFNGPVGFDRNLTQLMEYEKLYYLEIARGVPRNEIIQEHAEALRRMPLLSDVNKFPELWRHDLASDLRNQILFGKKGQVFTLYGILMPEVLNVRQAAPIAPTSPAPAARHARGFDPDEDIAPPAPP
jgi:hypothetical protein